jgi:hypothetical protein
MMADQKLLTQTLSEFAATLVKEFTISDVLHDLAERATAVVGADSAGSPWSIPAISASPPPSTSVPPTWSGCRKASKPGPV